MPDVWPLCSKYQNVQMYNVNVNVNVKCTTVKIAFTTEDDIRMSKHVLQTKSCGFFIKNYYHKTLLTTSPHCTRLYFHLISLTRVTTITWFRILTDTSPQLKSIPAGCWACLPCTPRWPAAVYCIKKILWQFRNITVDKKTCAIVCETRIRLFFGEVSVQTLPMGNSNAKMRFTIAFALSSK